MKKCICIHIYEAQVPQFSSPNPDTLSQKPTECTTLLFGFILCFQSPYFKLYFYFFNGQYASVCIFHKLKPRETYA